MTAECRYQRESDRALRLLREISPTPALPEPDDDLGSLDYLNRMRDVVAMVAIDYRTELATAINLMPEGVERWHLESLLHFVDRAIEAEVAFRDACREGR